MTPIDLKASFRESILRVGVHGVAFVIPFHAERTEFPQIGRRPQREIGTEDRPPEQGSCLVRHDAGHRVCKIGRLESPGTLAAKPVARRVERLPRGTPFLQRGKSNARIGYKPTHAAAAEPIKKSIIQRVTSSFHLNRLGWPDPLPSPGRHWNLLSRKNRTGFMQFQQRQGSSRRGHRRRWWRGSAAVGSCSRGAVALG